MHINTGQQGSQHQYATRVICWVLNRLLRVSEREDLEWAKGRTRDELWRVARSETVVREWKEVVEPLLLGL
jgi:hypothetical protein